MKEMTIGPCSVEYVVEEKEKIEEIPEFNNNIFPLKQKI
jgi:hypothetical protein